MEPPGRFDMIYTEMIDTEKVVLFRETDGDSSGCFLGGQPDWAYQPAWPVTSFSIADHPMIFVGQFIIPSTWHKLKNSVTAYLFWFDDRSLKIGFHVLYQTPSRCLNVCDWAIQYENRAGPTISASRHLLQAEPTIHMQQVERQLLDIERPRGFEAQVVMSREFTNGVRPFDHDLFSIPAHYLTELPHIDLQDKSTTWVNCSAHPTISSSMPTTYTSSPPTTHTSPDRDRSSYLSRPVWLVDEKSIPEPATSPSIPLVSPANPSLQCGGQPVWLHHGHWPVLKTESGDQPYRFALQCDLPDSTETSPRRLYVYLWPAYFDNASTDPMQHDIGEIILVLLQTPTTTTIQVNYPIPFGCDLRFVDTTEGPTICDAGLLATSTATETVAPKNNLPDYTHESAFTLSAQTKIGGFPGFIQQPEGPADTALLLQIDALFLERLSGLYIGDGVFYLLEQKSTQALFAISQC